MKKHKILIIGPTSPPYTGMSVATDTILNSSLREKFQIIHLNTVDRRAISNMGKLDVINITLALKHFFSFLRVVNREKPEVVYLPISQNSLGYLRDVLFLVPCRALRIKTIVHLHGGYFRDFYDESNVLMKKIVRYTLKKISTVIVLGECLKYIFKEFVSDKNIAVVPNGVEDAFDERLRKTSGAGVIKVLFLSNFLREKGIFIALHMIPNIVSKHRNVKFIFAGEWYSDKDQRQAKKFIAQNNIQSNVEFVGVVKGVKKKELLNNSDIFILPTFYPFEGQPLVILEAMSAGLPVITTKKGAISETIVDGENGFLIENKSFDQLKEKLSRLISNPDLRDRIREKNREDYLRKYTNSIFTDNLESILVKAIQEPTTVKDSVLFVAPVPPPYAGPEVNTEILLNSQISEEFDIIHLRSNLHTRNRDRGRLKLASMVRLLLLVLKISLIIVLRRPKVVYSFLCQNLTGFIRDSIIVIVCKLLNKKIILHFHGSNFSNFYNTQSKLFQKYIDFILRRVDFYILQAHWLKEFFMQFVSETRMRVIYNAIVADQFFENRQSDKKTDKRFKIFYMSYISEAKGFGIFADSCKELIREGVLLDIMVAGEVISRERNIFYSQSGQKLSFCDINKVIEDIKQHQTYRSSFTFLGEIKNKFRKNELFSAADVFVLPSYSEGCPMVILEAMAAGLPVIVTPVGALPEIIKDGENGLFVKIGDHRDLKEKINFLANNSLLCREMGEKNKVLIKSRFDIDKIIPQFRDLFKEMAYHD